MGSNDRVLPPGKLPGALLERLLSTYTVSDPSVLIGPGVGRDAAAIRVGDRALVVKTDPITFATADAGRYLVNVNANDIVCMGATPRWLLVTALLPEQSTTPQLVEEIFSSLANAASEIGVALVGGHTEITIGLDRPILVGQMLGEASPADLLDVRNSRDGDAILLCSPIAIEGTALLALEARSSLTSLDATLLESAMRLLVEPGISVIPAARALRQASVEVRGFHDPTEGGLATALQELATAAGRGIDVYMDAIPILAETQAICDALCLDPLGLIASGSLLAVVPQSSLERAIESLSSNDIHAATIGTIKAQGDESVALRNNERGQLPSFAVDEIARFFARPA